MSAKAGQVRREDLTDQEWQSVCNLFETIRRLKAKVRNASA